MTEEHRTHRYISDFPDYRHLADRERYKALYDEVGTVEANRVIRWREEWMKYFRPRVGSTILELGAHNGPNLLHYARLGHEINGVELSDTLIETFEMALRQEPEAVQSRIHIHRGWIEEFVPETRFDDVLCTEVLEHVIDPISILNVARTALKPNGRVYISSPSSLWGNNTHVRGVPVSDLRQWLDAAGLCPIQIWSEDGRTFCIAHDSDVRVRGMIRIRNEAAIIRDTLDHMARFCSGGIYVYDDVSTDDTVGLCESHSSVRRVIRGAYWDSNRGRANYENRAAVLAAAQQDAQPKDWFVYLDADERVDFDWSDLFDLPPDAIAVRMKLYDFYITAEDAHLDYRFRQWMGPEYRQIIIAYRNLPTLRFRHLGQREVELGTEGGRIVDSGYVKHYGKAISIAQWEETCNYYSTYFPAYAAKWNARRGKAIHTQSDFGQDLIRWEDKDQKGLLLTSEIESASARRHESGGDGPVLRILLANHHLLDFTGSELFTFTLADSLKRFGHQVTVYSPYVDKLRQPFESIGIRVVENVDDIRGETFDIAHVHHNIAAMEVRHSFPTLPMVYLSHGILPYLERSPAIDLHITQFLAVSEEVRDALVTQGVRREHIGIFRNIVDPRRFCPSATIREAPTNALVLSARMDERQEQIIREACAQLDINVTFRGGRFGEAAPSQLPLLINDADIVFSLGRGAIEAMMCGRIPIIFDYLGGDGMVMPENLPDVMTCNFSGRRWGHNYTVDDLIREIRKYRSENGTKLREVALELFDPLVTVPQLIDMYFESAKETVSPLTNTDEALLRAFVATVNETRSYSYNRLTRTIPQDRQSSRTGNSIPLPATGNTREQWQQWIPHLESLLWLNEEDPFAHNELGLLRYHTGDRLGALAHFQRALALLPENDGIRLNLSVLYPELVGLLIADLGGKTEHLQNLQVHIRNLEADLGNAKTHAQNLETYARNLETHTRNLETHVQNVETHAQNVETHVRNLEVHVQHLEVRTHELETHTNNLEEERHRLQHLLEVPVQAQPAPRMNAFVDKLVEVISKVRRDGIVEIAVYGSGETGRVLISLCRMANIRISCVIDKNERLWGTEIAGVPVVSLSNAMNDGNDTYVVGSFSFGREISRGIRMQYAETSRRPRIYVPVQERRIAENARESAPAAPIPVE